MKNIYCVICGKHRKFEKPKISYLLQKTLVLSIIYNKCKNEDEKIFQEKDSIEILKLFGLIEKITLKMWLKNLKSMWSQEFRLKNINGTRNFLIEEINQNELMCKGHKKVCKTLNYIEHVLILGSTTTGCVSISAFDSLVGICVGIRSSAIGLKFCAITAAIKKYKPIIKKKKKKHNKVVLLAKSKLNSKEVLISKALVDSVISHDEFVLINNVLKEHKERKEEIKI